MFITELTKQDFWGTHTQISIYKYTKCREQNNLSIIQINITSHPTFYKFSWLPQLLIEHKPYLLK